MGDSLVIHQIIEYKSKCKVRNELLTLAMIIMSQLPWGKYVSGVIQIFKYPSSQ
jgi:hypothetical protein